MADSEHFTRREFPTLARIADAVISPTAYRSSTQNSNRPSLMRKTPKSSSRPSCRNHWRLSKEYANGRPGELT